MIGAKIKFKELREILKAAESNGWRVEERSDGYMLFPADPSQSPIKLHRTPSDRRTLANTTAELKRRGLRWK